MADRRALSLSFFKKPCGRGRDRSTDRQRERTRSVTKAERETEREAGDINLSKLKQT